MVIRVEYVGAASLKANLHNFRKRIPTAATKATTEVAEQIRDTAKQLCPVDTGSLQKSIRLHRVARPGGHTVSIGVIAGGRVVNPKTGRVVDYARYVHDGTSRMAPRPFLAEAVAIHGSELARAVRRDLRRLRNTTSG